jgi:hypothetical protein
MTLTNATGDEVSDTVAITLTLVSGPDDYTVVDVYIDTLFGTFALQPGTYQIVVSHGPRYSVFKQMINVLPGSEASPQVVNANVVPVVSTTGFISGDFHVHLSSSPDSVVSRQERIITMMAEGVDYFVASDHDFVTDLTADVAALGATGAVKTALSQEITYFDSGHFGAYPFDPLNLPDPNSHTGGALDWGRAGVAVGAGYPSSGSYDLSPDEMALTAKSPPFNAIVVQANHFNSGTLGYLRLHGIFGRFGREPPVQAQVVIAWAPVAGGQIAERRAPYVGVVRADALDDGSPRRRKRDHPASVSQPARTMAREGVAIEREGFSRAEDHPAAASNCITPKSVPSVSVKYAVQPTPGTAIFGTASVPPAAATARAISSTDSTAITFVAG